MSKIMIFFQNDYFQDRLILVSLLACFGLNIIIWTALSGKFGYSHEPIALHFNIVSGIDFVGSSYRIYEIPLFGFIIASVNFAVSRLIYGRERLFSYFLTFGAAFAQFILLLAVFLLVRVNF